MAAFIELIERTNGKIEIHLTGQTNENWRVNAVRRHKVLRTYFRIRIKL